ncbi:MAG: hypothetical protein WC941_10760 [Candidatus Bathyarchaeia archaeon]
MSEATCTHCGYSWTPKSKLIYVTCPSCKRKVLNPNTKYRVKA